jgi:hypothetical protein
MLREENVRGFERDHSSHEDAVMCMKRDDNKWKISHARDKIGTVQS